jgi:polyisoprenoid-binding protein YceI
MWRSALVLSCVLLAGCGGVQRAWVGSAVSEAVDVDVAPARAAPPVTTRNALIRAEGSSIEVESGTLLGPIESHVTRFRGRLHVDARDDTRGRIEIDFDLTSLESATRLIALVLEYEFLEVDAHPHARLEATFRPAREGGDRRVVEGTLDLHGIRRKIAFEGRLTREGDEWRLTSAFAFDRHLFDLRQHDEWDWLNRNDVRLRVDLRATPERVTVEP